jgi:beta-lactamase class A
MRRSLVPILLALAGAPSGAVAQTSSFDDAFACLVPDSVRASLETIARRVGGEIGIAAIHVESGARVSLNGQRRFPMASVSKIPMAMEFLRRVDAGKFALSGRAGARSRSPWTACFVS